jgi:hypothetical protein
MNLALDDHVKVFAEVALAKQKLTAFAVFDRADAGNRLDQFTVKPLEEFTV